MNSQIPDIFNQYTSTRKKIPRQNGIIKVELESDENSKTFIKSLECKAPFLVQKAIYPDSRYPHFAHVYMMSSSGGILQGDKLDIDIILGKGALARITTQSATKIYKMKYGFASQYIDITSESESYLEFVPHQIIPFKSSRFYQEVNLNVEKNSTVVYSEIVSAGRIASGEKFDFDVCFLRTSAYQEGRLLFTDVMNMSHENKAMLESLFGSKYILSSIYVISDSIEHEKIDLVINLAMKNNSLLASYSSLPHGCGIIVRILADSVYEIVELTEAITEITKNHSYKTRNADTVIENKPTQVS